MSPYLSAHFSLAELTLSQTAARAGLDNTPSAEVVANLTRTAQGLEKVRALLGCALLVSSGYRSPEVNVAVGGAHDSAHLSGWAADFIAPVFGDPLAICRALGASDIAFDQVIQEGTWVHISFDPRMRRDLLTKTADGYEAGVAATPKEAA